MHHRVSLFGIQFDPLTMPQAVDRLLEIISAPSNESRYVVTPNVDHIVKLRNDPAFQAAYRDADLVLVDGKPVLLASRMLRRALPETVPGSDLAPELFAASERIGGISIFLLGSAEGVGDVAAANIRSRWPWVRVSGVYSPPMKFSAESPMSEVAIEKIRAAAPDVLVVGLGAPRQEIWVHRVRERLNAKTILCVGATIDFLAEKRSRAPLWMRRAGLEWLYRMLSEPRRMVGRYAYDAMVFPPLVVREWLGIRRNLGAGR
jgi:N-acetylglucosaminyldiphosphoundecaprenol N-acetyl-beta-D-mannosaminyltransferase